MTLLLDTCVLLWFLADHPRLPPNVKDLIEAATHRKVVSIASCWEIAIKAGLGKLHLGEPAATFLPRELVRNNFDLLGVNIAHATLVESLPPHHRDPFDRLIISQCLIEGFDVVTEDAIFDPYGVKRRWV